MVFENTPTALDGIVLTVIGWVIGQTHGNPILMHKIDHPLHELGPSTMVLWSVIEINDQRRDLGKPLLDGLPPLHEAIDQTITRDFGGDPKQKQFIRCWEQDAHRSHGRGGLEVVVGGGGRDAALPPTRERANFDRRFGVDRDA